MNALMKPPKRVQIVADTWGSYFKKGQFAYVIAVNSKGGMHWLDKSEPSKAGQKAYLVSKAKHGRGGALWFSRDGLRFTKRRGR